MISFLLVGSLLLVLLVGTAVDVNAFVSPHLSHQRTPSGSSSSTLSFTSSSTSSVGFLLHMVLYDPLRNPEHALVVDLQDDDDNVGGGDDAAATMKDTELFVDFPTPKQKASLKKEAKKRQARKELQTFKMPEMLIGSHRELTRILQEARDLEEQEGSDDDDEGDYDFQDTVVEEEEEDENEDDDSTMTTTMLYDNETLEDIWSFLQQHEAVLLKGVCRGHSSKRNVYTVGMWLCAMLEDLQVQRQQQQQQQRSMAFDNGGDYNTTTTATRAGLLLPVALLDTKGHSCLLYSPTLPLSDPKKFYKLRTSVGQKNTWTARIKAPRDHRGQIITT